MARFFKKDPSGVRDYSIDWSAVLDSAETIPSDATWTVPAGITKDAQSITGDITTIRLSGGTAGTSYTVTANITTSAGQKFERSIFIRVDER